MYLMYICIFFFIQIYSAHVLKLFSSMIVLDITVYSLFYDKHYAK